MLLCKIDVTILYHLMLVSWYDEETKKKKLRGKEMNERKKKEEENAQLMGNERQSSAIQSQNKEKG